MTDDFRPCPRCGEPLRDKANFCPNCGAPVSVPEASERRVVTVVFADLAGSTELASRLDAEVFRDVLAAFHGLVAEEVGWYRGVAEGFIGDAVLGVFGTPLARDDDAVRGIRTALAIVERVPRLEREFGLPVPIRVRVGVNTGRVGVGTAADRNIVIGAEVNKGARLQQAAEPGEILAGSTTHELTLDDVEFGPMRLIPAKGFEAEIPAWPVVRLLPSASRPDRSQIPYVDRRHENTLLTEAFERSRERGRAHLVTLLGEPGIGKSRVVDEFVATLPEDVKVLAGRSSAFEEEVTFWPIAQMLYREIGEERGAPEEQILGRLRDVVKLWVDADADDDEIERAARSLGFAMGLGQDEGEDDRYHAAEVRHGVLAMLTGLAQRGPVVLVFEDLQEADPQLLDLIEQLVREARRVPLIVLCVARWDFLEERPNWAGGVADAVTLWVEPLSMQDATQLAMEAGGLDRDDAERVATHSGGNPLFIVEITAMLLREERDLPPTTPAPSGRLLPPTVQAVIAARVDHLSPGARELVRRASVFPQGTFDLDELELVVEPREAWLAEAEDEELLLPDEERPGVWRFRSDILRDVAYESLAKRERQRLHLRVADRLSEPELADRYPRTIAFHLEQAARASLDLQPGERALAERAVEALTRAGDLARRRIESRSAADLYERALALAGAEDSWGTREAWIISMLGESRYWLGEFEKAEESFRRALALASEARDDRVVAHASRFLADLMLTIRGDDHLASALFDRSLEAARRLGEPVVLARTLLMAGWVPYWRAELDEAERVFREALEVARSSDRRDAWVESRALVGLSTVVAQAGDERESLALGTEALAVAEAAGQPFSAAIAHQAVAASMRRLMRLDDGLEHADRSVKVLRELGARWELASALSDRGAIHRLAARLDEAEQDLQEAFALCHDLNERTLVTWTAAQLALTLVGKGDLAAARRVLEDPLASATEREPGSMSAFRTAQASLALAAGDREAALARSQAALQEERGPRGNPTMEAAVRWWIGSVFGPEAAGGADAVEAARAALESNGRLQALVEPELVVHLS
jgi:class 3 adenylate cyclase/tetratricopeptide (TPR) repeat protein